MSIKITKGNKKIKIKSDLKAYFCIILSGNCEINSAKT